MRHLFRDVPEACDNTLLIAERADVQIELGKPSLPEFPVPDRFTRRDLRGPGAGLPARPDLWRAHASATAPRCRPRWWSASTTSSASSATWASPPTSSSCGTSSASPASRASGSARAEGRRPAAAWPTACKIVDLDPIRYDLLFERFLNPGRKQMPDIDMDFDERYRADVMRYAAEKYGSDRVAQVITFSTIKARAAVRDAARVLGKPYIVGDRIAKAMPPLVMGRDTPLQACLDQDRRARGRVRRRRRAARHARHRSRRQGGHRRRARASRACVARTASTPPRWSSPVIR